MSGRGGWPGLPQTGPRGPPRGDGYARTRRTRSRPLPRAARRCHRERHGEHGLVAQGPESGHPPPARPQDRPSGAGFRLPRGGEKAGRRRPEAGSDRADDRQPGLVAGGLGPLRRLDDPHGLACGRLLSPRRRPRGCRYRQPAFRATEFLAGQRQPRQGAAAAVADQEKIRQPGELGRPDRARRQCRLRIHGSEDLWFCLWPRGHLAPGKGYLLGCGTGVAGQGPLRGCRRRGLTRESARRGADGIDLCESGRGRWPAGSPEDRGGRARDFQAHGHER